MLKIFKKRDTDTMTTKFSRVLVSALILLVIAFILLSCYRKTSFFSVDSSTYQAVFLSNDQVYFGKLKTSLSGMPYITDVYYLSSDRQINGTASPSDTVNLIKLGGEVHGPEDYIYLSENSIVFWENLKQDSVVVKTILDKSR